MSTPTLTDVIISGVEKIMSNIHTAMPGRIESFDINTQLAKIKPLLNRKYTTDNIAKELPVISNVPVIFPRSANAFLRLPIAFEDTVLIIFCERSIDRWLDQGGTVDPLDPEKFGLNGAVAIAGIYPKSGAFDINGSSDSLEIAHGTNFIEIKNDGEILIKNGQANLQIDASGNVKISALKITLESPNINLGDESGEALIKKSDLNTLFVPGATGGGPGLPVTNTAVGTLKVKAT